MPAARYLADRRDQLQGRVALEQVAVDADGEEGAHVLLVTVAGQDQDLDLRQVLVQRAGDLDAVEVGQVDVEQHHVGAHGLSQGQRLAPAGRLGHDLDIGSLAQQAARPRP